MGAGGVIVPPKGYWTKIQAVLKKYDILLVADEVICGFGRLGTMFGSESMQMQPDVMMMSKQITSSYMPFSAIMVNDRMFEPIADESDTIGVFGHGFTGGGHPVGAAVALETIKIIEERDLVVQAAETGAYMQHRLGEMTDHPMVGEVRGFGMLGAVELVHDKATKAPYEAPGKLGALVNADLTERGVILRNMIDAMALCPPLISTREDIDVMVDGLAASIDAVHGSIAA